MTETEGEVTGETGLTWIREGKVGKRTNDWKKKNIRSETERQKTRERREQVSKRQCKREETRETQEENRNFIEQQSEI